MVHLTYCTRRNTRLTSHLKELHKLPQLSVRYLPSRFPTITQGATLVYLKFECLLHLMLARSSYRSLVIPVEHICTRKSMVSRILGKRGRVYGTVQAKMAIIMFLPLRDQQPCPLYRNMDNSVPQSRGEG